MDGRKNNGGKRVGAGRPPVKNRKKTFSFSADEDVEKKLNDVENRSRFINESVRLNMNRRNLGNPIKGGNK